MIYRELGGTGIAVSEVGFGGEHLEGKESAIVERTVHAALDAGINLFDVFMSEPNVRTNIGRGLAGRRDRAGKTASTAGRSTLPKRSSFFRTCSTGSEPTTSISA